MPTHTDELQTALATTLVSNLSAFRAFARRRLGDDTLAADAVQESLLRALKSDREFADEKNVLAWFYRILRNVLIDLHRRRSSESSALERFAAEPNDREIAEPQIEEAACSCFHAILPTLPQQYGEVLQLSDLDGGSPDDVAEQLGISKNNLKVRLHRARRQLRERLEQTCRVCATHGCLDCRCDSPRP